MKSLLIDNIGYLATNDPTIGEGALGVLRDASLVIEGGRVAEVGGSGRDADHRIDAAGRCVIPGFVDSHT
ncbi:MAG: imidazolonepropionase, partial [Thermoleophilia bacterium]|nr:imidazolonepropionase [Thermoleophilia bacterium]